MRVDLPPNTSLHIAPGLTVSLRGDGVHVRSRHRSKAILAALVGVALSGAGGFVAGSWDKVADASTEDGAAPASLQEPMARPPSMRNAAAQPGPVAQTLPTVVAAPPNSSAERQADPFGLRE